jgi:hypothetical protein
VRKECGFSRHDQSPARKKVCQHGLDLFVHLQPNHKRTGVEGLGLRIQRGEEAAHGERHEFAVGAGFHGGKARFELLDFLAAQTCRGDGAATKQEKEEANHPKHSKSRIRH